MSMTEEVPCNRCDGSGIEPVFPALDNSTEFQPATVCTSCQGQGHVRQNAMPQPTRMGRAEL